MTYRYDLHRRIKPGNRVLGWVMLNPSTADETTDDATIRKCMGFTVRAGRTPDELFSRRLFQGPNQPPDLHPPEGYDAFLVANLFPVRATDPNALFGMSDAERSGPPDLADEAILVLTRKCLNVVCAWGAHGVRFQERTARVLDLLRPAVNLCYLGLTVHGEPRHPLRVGYTTPLSLWRGAP